MFGQLADSGGFARTIHARHHDDGGLMFADLQRAFQGAQEIRKGRDEEALNLIRALSVFFFHALLHGVQ